MKKRYNFITDTEILPEGLNFVRSVARNLGKNHPNGRLLRKLKYILVFGLLI